MFISISSEMSLNGFKLSAVAKSRTTIGGLRWMTLIPPSSVTIGGVVAALGIAGTAAGAETIVGGFGALITGATGTGAGLAKGLADGTFGAIGGVEAVDTGAGAETTGAGLGAAAGGTETGRGALEKLGTAGGGFGADATGVGTAAGRLTGRGELGPGRDGGAGGALGRGGAETTAVGFGATAGAGVAAALAAAAAAAAALAFSSLSRATS